MHLLNCISLNNIRISNAFRRHNLRFCGRVPWLYQYWPGGFMLFVVLCPGTPEGSTGSGSGFKRLRRRGNDIVFKNDIEMG